jgi:hypothetical protein
VGNIVRLLENMNWTMREGHEKIIINCNFTYDHTKLCHLLYTRQLESENMINVPIDVVWQRTVEILPTERMPFYRGLF